MKLQRDSKVYVVCPGNIHTGGPESLHQLASQLISFGVETYMVYSALADFFNPDDPVHHAYKKYHVPYTTLVEDHAKNIMIVPETSTVDLFSGKKIRHVLWWMSVNYYLTNIMKIMEHFLKDPLAAPVRKFFTFYDEDKNLEHWFKSEYARQFLEVNGIPAKKMRHVESYMSQTFLSRAEKIDLSAKKNLVAFNPRKGFEITQQLMNAAPDIDWRPIENMTPAQVQELLAQAKIYIDFGTHPGKDRLPREATISKCVVITGRRGAAANDVDYNIPAEFKFNDETHPLQVIEKIREVFENFTGAFAAQKNFRDKELNAKKNFAEQIAAAFEIKNFPPESVALVQGVGEKSYLIDQVLLKTKNFVTKFIVDDAAAALTDTTSEKFIRREQNRNFLRFDKEPIEIISRDDAKFLYLEGRIKKFALFEPIAAEFDDVKKFFEPNFSDVLIFSR